MLHLNKNIFFFLVFLLGIKTGFSQSCNLTIKGKVEDKHHAEGLEFATIVIEETGTGTNSDEKGIFEISQLCPGKYHLLVNHLGCEGLRVYISLERDTTIQFDMEHHTTMLSDVVVTESISRSGIGLQQYTISGSSIQALAGKDIAQIASYIPGVSILKSGASLGKPIINGLFGNRIQILNQGIPQEGQQWGNDHAPEIDAFTSQKMTVIKGSAAVKYGVNALAGVLILESLPIKADPHVHGHFITLYQNNGRSFTNNVTLEQSLKSFNYRLIASYKKAGDQFAPGYFLTNTGQQSYSGALLISNDAGSKWHRSMYLSTYNANIGILRGAHIGNITDLEEALKKSQPFYTNEQFSYHINSPRQEVNHHLVKLENKYNLGGDQFLSMDLSTQWNLRREYDVRRGDRDTLASLNLKLWSFWSDIYYNNTSNEKKITLGYQQKISSNANVAGTGIYPLIPNYTLFNPSLYTSYAFPIYGLVGETGGRYEFQWLKAAYIDRSGNYQNKAHKYHNFAFNVGASFNIGKIISSKMNFALTHRAPQIHELYSNGLHQGLAAIEEGNPNLESEKSFKWTTDFKIKISEEQQINLAFYYHLIKDYIYLQPSGMPRLTIRGAFPLYQYQQSDANIKGLDLMFNQGIDHLWEINARVSYIDGKNSEDHKQLVYMPPFSAKLDVSRLQEKIWFFRDLKFGIEGQYVAKQNGTTTANDLAEPPEAYALFHLFAGGKKQF